MACGIQEHNEARRKERLFERRNHYRQKLKDDGIDPDDVMSHPTYRAQLMADVRTSNPNDHPYAQKKAEVATAVPGVTYTPKLPNRFSETDYKQQW